MAAKTQGKRVAPKAPTKVAISRWSSEELDTLKTLAEDRQRALTVEQISAEFCAKFPKAHSADAVKQRVFKMRRERAPAPKHSFTARQLGGPGPLALTVNGVPVAHGSADELISLLAAMKG